MEDNVLEAESPCRASKKNHHDHGQSAVEMAALAPLVTVHVQQNEETQ